MGRYYGAIDGLKLAWKNFRNPELIKWSAAVGVLTAFLSLLVAFLTAGAAISDVPRFMITTIVLELIFMLPLLYLAMRMMRSAMTANGIKISKQTPAFLDYIVLNIRIFFTNIVCWYNKKSLLPAAALLGLALVAFISGFAIKQEIMAIVALMLLILAFVAWVVAVFMHTIHLLFAPFFFLRGDGPEGEMPQKSFEQIRGRIWPIVCGFFGVPMLASLISLIPSLAVTLIAAIVTGVIAFVVKSELLSVALNELISLPLLVLLTAYMAALQMDIFKFFDEQGPVESTADAAKSAKDSAASKAKKK
jgi:hypothetical protein